MPAATTLENAFTGLPDATRTRIARAAVERTLRQGQTLFRAGDDADALYVVLSGRIRVSRETPDHLEFLHFGTAGGILGEIPVFGGGAFPATAVAAEPSRCARIPVSEIERLLRESPEFVRFAIHRLARRAHSLLIRIDELTLLTIPARVARFILSRADSADEFTLGVSQSSRADQRSDHHRQRSRERHRRCRDRPLLNLATRRVATRSV